MTTGPYTRATGNPATLLSTSEALRALAHPLRMRLIGLLRRDGPATASALARTVGESSGSTSYHLRQLARFGLVELDREQPNRRDKRWRAVEDVTDVDVSSLEDPAALAALDRIVQLQLQRFGAHAAAATRLPAEELKTWGPAMNSSDAVIRLTPALLTELRDELLQLLARYDALGEQLDPDDPEVRRVSIYAGAVPLTGDGTLW